MGIHYKEYGNKEGPLLVFLHGGGVGGWMWDKQIDHFGDYHCLIPTLQGHGPRSEESSFSIKGNALEVIQLIEEKKNGREVNLVGFSIGAQITLEILSLAPNLLHSALVNSALVMPRGMLKVLIAPSIKLTYSLIRNRTFSKLQAKQLYIEEDYFERYYEDSVKMNANLLIGMMEENLAYKLPEKIVDCTARVIITVGEKEKKVMRKSARKIADGHSSFSLLVIPKVGHGFSLAFPEQFNQLVERWLMEQPISDLYHSLKKQPRN